LDIFDGCENPLWVTLASPSDNGVPQSVDKSIDRALAFLASKQYTAAWPPDTADRNSKEHSIRA